jgi:hypothetical protein
MSNRAVAALVLAVLVGVEVYGLTRWFGLSGSEKLTALLAFLCGLCALIVLIWRVPPTGIPRARWLFRERETLGTGSGRWLIGGACGVALAAVIPLGVGVALAAFLAGLTAAVVVLGALALAGGHVGSGTELERTLGNVRSGSRHRAG